jgi:hypothetical protein
MENTGFSQKANFTPRYLGVLYLIFSHKKKYTHSKSQFFCWQEYVGTQSVVKEFHRDCTGTS